MGKICKVLGIIIGVLGVVGSASLAKTFGGLYSSYSEMNWGVAFSVFLGGALSSAAIAFLLLGVSEVLEKISYLEYLAEGTKDCIEKSQKTEEITENTWKCPVCGKNNPMYTGTCSCGQGRD